MNFCVCMLRCATCHVRPSLNYHELYHDVVRLWGSLSWNGNLYNLFLFVKHWSAYLQHKTCTSENCNFHSFSSCLIRLSLYQRGRGTFLTKVQYTWFFPLEIGHWWFSKKRKRKTLFSLGFLFFLFVTSASKWIFLIFPT